MGLCLLGGQQHPEVGGQFLGDRGGHHLGADGDHVVPDSGENPSGKLPAGEDLVVLLLPHLVTAGPPLQPPVLHQQLVVLLNTSEPVDVWKC